MKYKPNFFNSRSKLKGSLQISMEWFFGIKMEILTIYFTNVHK